MAKQLLLRTASALGVVALAAAFVGVAPLLTNVPSAGSSGLARTPPVSVDRTLKGDRLPSPNSAVLYIPDWQYEFGVLSPAKPHAQIPLGCDPAFSPIFAPAASNVYRRCMA